MKDKFEFFVNVLIGAVIAGMFAAAFFFWGCATGSNMKHRNDCDGYYHQDDRIRCERDPWRNR